MSMPTIKAVQEALGLNNKQMAAELGCSTPTIVRVRGGRAWTTGVPDKYLDQWSDLVNRSGLNGAEVAEEIIAKPVVDAAEVEPDEGEIVTGEGESVTVTEESAAEPNVGVEEDAEEEVTGKPVGQTLTERLIASGIPVETEKRMDSGPDAEPELLGLVLSACTPWHDHRGSEQTAYVTINIGRTDTGESVVKHMKVRSAETRRWIQQHLFEVTGKAIGQDKLRDLVNNLEAQSICNGGQHRAWGRTAPNVLGDELWLNLARADGKVVRITEDGWFITYQTGDAPRMVRTAATAEMPIPEHNPDLEGYGLDELLSVHLNLGEDTPTEQQARAARFVAAWCVSAMRPQAPYWLADFTGEQGTGKSTACRILKRLTDPGGAADAPPPKSPHDLAVVAANQRVVALDNLSKITPVMSDALCRMATGSTMQNRALYTDGDVAFISIEAAGILNGIADVVTRPDLADRTLPITLTRPEQRRTEKQIYREFDKAHPHLLAVLCDGLAKVMEVGERVEMEMHPASAPRMMDCAVWACAAGEAWGWVRMGLLEDLNAVQQELAHLALDTPIHRLLTKMLVRLAAAADADAVDTADAVFRVHAKSGELQVALLSQNAHTPIASQDAQYLPRTGRGMRELIDRVAPALRLLGWSIEHATEGRGNDRAPYFTIDPPWDEVSEYKRKVEEAKAGGPSK